MSVFGTGSAAGVAQTGLQAQQVARQRDKRETQSAADARRMRDLLEVHFLALEEGDESQDLAKLRIDGQVPDHPGGREQPQSPSRKPAQTLPEEASPSADQSDEPTSSDALYRHLDIRA